jgi:hypothetical protein
MIGPESDTDGTKPISVAELLARNGTLGAPAVTRRRRRRRGDGDTVTVAELTGEIPVIRDDDEHQATRDAAAEPHAPAANGVVQQAAPADPPASDAAAKSQAKTAYWSEPEPRWPKAPPQIPRPSGPERSAYPRPLRNADVREAGRPTARAGQPEQQSGAEDMSPDPLDHYAGGPVDMLDSDVREAEPAGEDSAYVRSYLQASDATLFGGQTLADELARRRGEAKTDANLRVSGPAGAEGEKDHLDGAAARPRSAAQDARTPAGRLVALWRGSLIVLQSILAVAFGAGLFVAFDELWRWNSMVALVLSVLVILGLVVGVRVVRKTEDIASTLIAVAVGALITLGPLALSMQTG